MLPQNPTAASRTRLILEDLEAVRENLLALSDDIWLSIDHNDEQALEEGVDFKRAYNTKVAAFDSVASELSELVQQYTSVRLDEAEQASGSDREQNERIIAELDREDPHLLNEDFTYKRPYGFILDRMRRRVSPRGNGSMGWSASISFLATKVGFGPCMTIPTSSATVGITR
ncbi:hypothetical protein Pla52o_27770 [Novipirellula galeiformis]|uniref:Uncharacterized protein n=1 Tax=Novipirellula galeiformis TaxID=2528004 RepID=A0A5C6CIP2_9BACT|nr:hypothetical protein [Novipirellula galeiformis]TWU23241.1 hypothetical protein Pla52o_27770 [Novipirellula galeiformis]